MNRVDDAIDANAKIANAILNNGTEALGLASDPSTLTSDGAGSPLAWHSYATPEDMEKARTTIRLLYRDWSKEGQAERDAHYRPILKDLNELFEMSDDQRSRVRVLIPGAGLGRLVFEICKAGFAAEGNEISFHMLLASNWVLNAVPEAEAWTLYPFDLTFANVVSREKQMRSVQIPDVHPGRELAGIPGGCKGSMSMAAADFLLLYGDEEHKDLYDAVVTCFFLDTAPNVIRYVETIRNALKPGALWVNVGPLLWHFEGREQRTEGTAQEEQERREKLEKGDKTDLGIAEPGSVELTADELGELLVALGFRIVKWEIEDAHKTGYIQDPESLLHSSYKVLHFVVQKGMSPDTS